MPADRSYPTRPIVGVCGVIFMDEGRVVLVKRRHEPLAGHWSLPGGALELGETLHRGIAREIHEETGLVVDVGPVVDVVDRIISDESGAAQYHFVIVDYLCHARGGTLQAGTDVEAIALADPATLQIYRVAEPIESVVRRAWQLREGCR